jgi:hypothetical protein
MTATHAGYSRISAVWLALLADTGWWEPDFSVAEPLVWGNWSTVLTARRKDFVDFATGPPQLTWPKHCVAKTNADGNSEGMHFDYMGWGKQGSIGTLNCAGEISQLPHCVADRSFYDALGTGGFGLPQFDFAQVRPIDGTTMCSNQSGATENT